MTLPLIDPGACTHYHAKCIDSRPKDGYRIRRYLCARCGERWTTVEVRVDVGKYDRGAMAALEEKLSLKAAEKQLESVKDAISILVDAFGMNLPPRSDVEQA